MFSYNPSHGLSLLNREFYYWNLFTLIMFLSRYCIYFSRVLIILWQETTCLVKTRVCVPSICVNML